MYILANVPLKTLIDSWFHWKIYPQFRSYWKKKTKSGFTLNFILGDIGAKDKWWMSLHNWDTNNNPNLITVLKCKPYVNQKLLVKTCLSVMVHLSYSNLLYQRNVSYNPKTNRLWFFPKNKTRKHNNSANVHTPYIHCATLS